MSLIDAAKEGNATSMQAILADLPAQEAKEMIEKWDSADTVSFFCSFFLGFFTIMLSEEKNLQRFVKQPCLFSP